MKIKKPPNPFEKPALDAPDNNWSVSWSGKYMLSGDRVKKLSSADALLCSLQKDKSGSIKTASPDGSYIEYLTNVSAKMN